jgi:hypothetical protein
LCGKLIAATWKFLNSFWRLLQDIEIEMNEMRETAKEFTPKE